jgi:hypothetical protein
LLTYRLNLGTIGTDESSSYHVRFAVVKEIINDRIERIQAAIAILRSQIEQIESSGEVAPAGCLVMRYQAQGSRAAYWYYKLQANSPIFPTSRDKAKKSKYKHLGKAGSPAHIDAVMLVI